jgi:hypothetical protein
MVAALHPHLLMCQYLYSCTSKASKLSTTCSQQQAARSLRSYRSSSAACCACIYLRCSYISTNTDAEEAASASAACFARQFTRFISTKVQILTQKKLPAPSPADAQQRETLVDAAQKVQHVEEDGRRLQVDAGGGGGSRSSDPLLRLRDASSALTRQLSVGSGWREEGGGRGGEGGRGAEEEEGQGRGSRSGGANEGEEARAGVASAAEADVRDMRKHTAAQRRDVAVTSDEAVSYQPQDIASALAAALTSPSLHLPHSLSLALFLSLSPHRLAARRCAYASVSLARSLARSACACARELFSLTPCLSLAHCCTCDEPN